MVALGALVAFGGMVVAAVVATILLVLAVRDRVPGIAWWRALVAGDGLTEKGRQHRRHGYRLVVLAFGLWLISGFLASLLICCEPPG